MLDGIWVHFSHRFSCTVRTQYWKKAKSTKQHFFQILNIKNIFLLVSSIKIYTFVLHFIIDIFNKDCATSAVLFSYFCYRVFSPFLEATKFVWSSNARRILLKVKNAASPTHSPVIKVGIELIVKSFLYLVPWVLYFVIDFYGEWNDSIFMPSEIVFLHGESTN